jgi:hypothetical protein
MDDAPQSAAIPGPRPPRIVKAKVEKFVDEPNFTAERDQRLDPVRGRIAVLLTVLLCFALLLHSGLTFWASYGSPDAPKNIAAVFNIWVPVIAGLASSAVTWFFTHRR